MIVCGDDASLGVRRNAIYQLVASILRLPAKPPLTRYIKWVTRGTAPLPPDSRPPNLGSARDLRVPSSRRYVPFPRIFDLAVLVSLDRKQTRNILQKTIFPLALILSTSAFGAGCYPIIVTYEGFSGKKGSYTILKEAMNERKLKKCKDSDTNRVKFVDYQHGDKVTSISFLKNYHRSQFPVEILLIGYSWGGDTAYEVAETLQKDGINTLLITIDPVSLKAWPLGSHYKNIPNPTNRWLNVYALNPIEGSYYKDYNYPKALLGYSSCDEIASLGGAWGRQFQATYNKSIGDSGYPHDHCRVDDMLGKVLPDIKASIECGCTDVRR